jgi:cyclophilin family peptidyl-prolyl cis-trans isomerase
MSQPPRKKKSKQESSYSQPSPGGKARQQTGAGSRQAGRQGTQPTQRARGSQPPVTRRPVQQSGQSNFSREVDRRLPPFSLQRYVVIWLLGMIPLVIVLLLLLQPFGGNNQGSQGGQQTAQATATTATGSFATDGTPAGQAGAVATPTLNALNVPQVATSGPGKYMVIDTTKGKIVAKLYTEAEANVANTVANFEEKAKAGYFNGLTFHRVEDWVIQGGDPQGTGSGGGKIPSEYNMVPFGAGALGVARGQDPAINNDSQFFITKTPAGWLDGQYTNWGQVTEGMDVVNAIAIGDKINSITIEERQ